MDDLAASGLADRVVVLAFSEFGRRVAENGSAGTDHPHGGAGAAGGVERQGGLDRESIRASPRIWTRAISRCRVDFRRVYATILDGWLGLPSRTTLGGTFEALGLLKP